MDKTPATADSWKNNPMPPERKLFDLDLALSPEEYQRALQGHVPASMDDKWFIYFEDGWLNLHRSWTGSCIYRLRFELSGKEYRVVEAWVNRSLAEYKFKDEDEDRRIVKLMIDLILLGSNRFPSPGRETQA